MNGYLWKFISNYGNSKPINKIVEQMNIEIINSIIDPKRIKQLKQLVPIMPIITDFLRNKMMELYSDILLWI